MNLRDEVAQLLAPTSGPSARIRFGVIVAAHVAGYYAGVPWPTLDVSLGGGPTIPGVRYDDALAAPTAGQQIWALQQGTTLLVAGRLAE